MENKVAIITGGASGIGEASVKLFNKEGAKVTIADIDEDRGRRLEQAINKDRDEAVFIKTDVSKPEQVKELIDKTVDKFGKLDVLFNNAGIEGPLPPPETAKVDEADLDKVIDINLKGVFYGCKYAIEYLSKEKGNIINTSSIASIVGFAPLSPYSAAKGGINALTKELAVELAPASIRVNAIAPGYIETAMTERFNKAAGDPSAFLEPVLARQLIKRGGKPSEIAHCALFLASSEASFVTGHILVADGGYCAC